MFIGGIKRGKNIATPITNQFTDISHIDDFIEEYVKTANKIALFQSDSNWLVGNALVGFAARKLWNASTQRRGNRLFLFVLSPSSFGKSWVFWETPSQILSSRGLSELGFEEYGNFSIQRLGEDIQRAGKPKMVYIDEFTGILNSWAEGLPEFIIQVYNGGYVYRTKSTSFELTGEKGYLSFIMATTPANLHRELLRGKIIDADTIISSGFLPRFLVVGVRTLKREERRTILLRQSENLHEFERRDLLNWLLQLTAVRGRVVYSGDAIREIVDEALQIEDDSEAESEKVLFSRMKDHLAALAANIAISRVNPSRFGGGRIVVEVEHAAEAIDTIAEMVKRGRKYIGEATANSFRVGRVSTSRVLDFIRAGRVLVDGKLIEGSIKLSELSKRLYDNYGVKRSDLEFILQTLEENEEVVRGRIKTASGRPPVIVCATDGVDRCSTCPLADVCERIVPLKRL